MKVSTQKNIGRNLRTLRKHRDLSQSEMAEAAGLTRSTYVQYELGNRAPDAEALYDVALCFGLNMESFFEPDNESFVEDLYLVRDFTKGENELLRNYNKLSPFFKGILLEKSIQMVEMAVSRQIMQDNIHSVRQ